MYVRVFVSDYLKMKRTCLSTFIKINFSVHDDIVHNRLIYMQQYMIEYQ